MTDVKRFFVIPAHALWMGVVLVCALPAGTHAGTSDRVTHNAMADLGPTIFISGDPPKQSTPALAPRARAAKKRPVQASPAKARPAARAPLPPVIQPHASPFDITSVMPRGAIGHSAVMTPPDLPRAETRISVRPRLLFDAQRNALPANLLQVDPSHQIPLMRQAVGVDSEYVRRLIGVEVGYSASGSDEKSRFLFDVRTNSLDQETVRAAVGIPLN